jgi:hypothetical protein
MRFALELSAVAPPGVGIAIGIIGAIAGAFWMVIGVSRSEWTERFRSGWHYGRQPNARPVTRGGLLFERAFLVAQRRTRRGIRALARVR